jgi:tetratricopeptide (TPR) repeat protein
MPDLRPCSPTIACSARLPSGVPSRWKPTRLCAPVSRKRSSATPVALAPQGVRGLQSLAALRFARGEYDEAERVQRQAVALNPHDPESLAQLGWRLMARGKWEEGGTLLQEAIDRSMVVPAWYHESLALALYLGGDLQRARDEAELGKEDCCPGYATLAITEAALGNAAAARAALDEARRQSPLLFRDPAAYWANFQGAQEVIERLNAGLAKAGLRMPQSSLGVGHTGP